MSGSHSSSDDSNDSRKRPPDHQLNTDTSPKRKNCDENVHLKILVPSIAVGAVIGRSGEAIERVQRETNTKVKISKQDEFYPGTTERVCLVIGSMEGVMAVHNYIMDRIMEKPDPNPYTTGEGRLNVERRKQVSTIRGNGVYIGATNDPEDLSKAYNVEINNSRLQMHSGITGLPLLRVKVLVPNSTAGMVIGKGGSYIQEIKERTGAYVQISQKSREFNLVERCIVIAGELDQTRAAVYLILGVIVADPQSSSYPNLSYQNVQGPVASVHPTGSPYALPVIPSPVTSGLGSSADLSNLVLNTPLPYSESNIASGSITFNASNALGGSLNSLYSSTLAAGSAAKTFGFFASHYPIQSQQQQLQQQSASSSPGATVAMPNSIGQSMAGLLRTLLNAPQSWTPFQPALTESQPAFYATNANALSLPLAQQQQQQQQQRQTQTAALLASLGAKSQDSQLVCAPAVSTADFQGPLPLLSGPLHMYPNNLFGYQPLSAFPASSPSQLAYTRSRAMTPLGLDDTSTICLTPSGPWSATATPFSLPLSSCSSSPSTSFLTASTTSLPSGGFPTSSTLTQQSASNHQLGGGSVLSNSIAMLNLIPSGSLTLPSLLSRSVLSSDCHQQHQFQHNQQPQQTNQLGFPLSSQPSLSTTSSLSSVAPISDSRLFGSNSAGFDYGMNEALIAAAVNAGLVMNANHGGAAAAAAASPSSSNLPNVISDLSFVCLNHPPTDANGSNGGGLYAVPSAIPNLFNYRVVVSVPESLIGLVVGHQGRSIADLQSVTGTLVQISQQGVYFPGTQNRLVTLTGSQPNVKWAISLIEQTLNVGHLQYVENQSIIDSPLDAFNLLKYSNPAISYSTSPVDAFATMCPNPALNDTSLRTLSDPMRLSLASLTSDSVTPAPGDQQTSTPVTLLSTTTISQSMSELNNQISVSAAAAAAASSSNSIIPVLSTSVLSSSG